MVDVANDIFKMRLDGKVAIVTGGASGIGEATAKLFAHVGAKVVIADINANEAKKVVNDIERDCGEATFISTDVSNPTQAQAMAQYAIDTYGRVDILFNNAGISIRGLFWEMDCEDWDRLIAVNQSGHFYCAKFVVPYMLKQGGGAIVNNSSVLAYATHPGLAAYTTSKTAVLGMTKAMALDLAKNNIRVNCIVPGSIDTPMMWQDFSPEELPEVKRKAVEAVPVGRVAQPSEIASAVLFLVSPASSLVTGAVLIADGARLTKIGTEY